MLIDVMEKNKEEQTRQGKKKSHLKKTYEKNAIGMQMLRLVYASKHGSFKNQVGLFFVQISNMFLWYNKTFATLKWLDIAVVMSHSMTRDTNLSSKKMQIQSQR